ncbi:hypothetical protein OSSY52_06880 [Tepiditoga spiralis]|uniref:Uncharacterized protein n=1 Tax=Tepiditoga spiralis TaxID=2108365 RepID=A0A7G1G6M7_9BACT|nr:hypothetical protein [Tepiditoga spiralis]BBE30547.1 hypothetical protein OSSY52_06880 [Tepiditoga spiralis]
MNINVELRGIKNETLSVEPEKFQSFNDMITEYTNETEGILTYLKINDKEIPISYISELQNAHFEGGENIVLEFKPKKDVLMTLCDEALVYLNKVKENSESFSKELLLNTQEGQKMLSALSEGFQSLLKIIEQIEIFSNKKIYSDEDIEKIKKVIESMFKAQEEKDTLELSDIVDFDFEEILKLFEEIFEEGKRLLNESFN